MAIPVMVGPDGPTLSPFFAKSDGILVIEPESGSQRFAPNHERTADSLCALLISENVARLVCGFIAAAHKERLESAGLDIRLASGTLCVPELAQQFAHLPKA